MKFCPKLRISGTCLVEGCAFSHDITLFCFECNILCPNANGKSEHLIGKRHQTTLKIKQPTPTTAVERHCDTCDVAIPGGQEAWRVHIEGARHQRNLSNKSQASRTIPDEFSEYCHVCNKSFTSILEYIAHNRSAEHQAGLPISSIAATLKNDQADKHGISVTPGDGVIDFGLMTSRTLKDHPWRTSALSVVASADHIRMTNARFLSTGESDSMGGVFSARYFVSVPMRVRVPATVTVSLWPGTYRGELSDTLELVFENTAKKRSFVISRSVCAVVGVEDGPKVPPPTVPYVRLPKPTDSKVKTPMLAPDPPQAQSIPHTHQLQDYPLDESFLTVGSLDQRIAATQNMLPQVLNGETYQQCWSTLLHIEEGQMNIDMEAYDLKRVPLERYEGCYYLEVLGLKEGRPSVAIGDSVRIRWQRNPEQWFEGRVHVVREMEIGMKFQSSFIYQPNDLCDARFTINRKFIRCLHYALDKSFFPDRIIFPSPQHIKGLNRPFFQEMAAIRPVNRKISSNTQQLEAITAIVNHPPGSVPFVVFGPPGTGKTTTIVEAIRQILNRDPSARILACAPSNEVADVIAEHLLDLGPRQVFRLNAPSRSYSQLPDSLRDFSYKDPDGHFSMRSKEDLESYRIVVSTCISTSILEGVGVEAGHFSHIFIDEAGQATEPEVMVPIRIMADPFTNIVLTGGPQQLDPIIRSDVINHLGLGLSYLNRLVDREVYDYGTHSGVTIVQLINDYGSNQATISLASNAPKNRDSLQMKSDLAMGRENASRRFTQ